MQIIKYERRRSEKILKSIKLKNHEVSGKEAKKEYLRGYQKALYEIKLAEEELESLQAEKLYSSAFFDGMPRSKSGKADLANYMIKLEKLEQQYIKRRYQATVKAEEIKDCIYKLECEKEKTFLILRYIRLRKLEEICEEMNYSWKHIHNIHAKALNNLLVP